MLTIDNAIGGKLVRSVSTRTSGVYNPATGEQSAVLPLSTLDEINAAVASAKAAFPAWAATTPMKRARVMFKFKELLERHADEIAREISKEHGKVHDDAMGELARGVEVVEFACGIPNCSRESSRAMWPLESIAIQFAIRSACCGYHAIQFSRHGANVDVPRRHRLRQYVRVQAHRARSVRADAGVETVHGGRSAGGRLERRAWRQGSGGRHTDPPDSRLCASSARPRLPGMSIDRHQAENRVQPFGGAKNHMIIMPDADLDQAADALMGAGYGSAGERCMAISVAVPVGDDTADALVAKLKPRVKASRSARPPTRTPKWVRSSPRCIATRSLVTSIPASSRAPSWW